MKKSKSFSLSQTRRSVTKINNDRSVNYSLLNRKRLNSSTFFDTDNKNDIKVGYILDNGYEDADEDSDDTFEGINLDQRRKIDSIKRLFYPHSKSLKKCEILFSGSVASTYK